jgi:F420H(2)-dependent quinone reductase
VSLNPRDFDWVREQVAEFEASGGTRANTLWDTGYPIIVITSIGARSNSERKNPVMRVERDGEYLAVASLGGAPMNPSWYHNLVANPVVQLQDGPEKRSYVAHLLSGEEREQWWAHAVETWPTYAEYQAKTERQIPLFLLKPV